MELYERLIELRKKADLSQEKLAETLNISRQAVSKWETAATNPDLNNIIQLSAVYGVSTDYILLGKPESTELPAIIQIDGEPPETDRFHTNKFLWFELSVIMVIILYYMTNGF